MCVCVCVKVVFTAKPLFAVIANKPHIRRKDRTETEITPKDNFLPFQISPINVPLQ